MRRVSDGYLTGIATDLLDHYGIDKAGWIGTSMGGLIGMRMASGPLAERIGCLIINDIGPEIPQEAIDRILAYASDLPTFDQVSQAEMWLRSVYAPFGPAPDEFWTRMARTSVRRRADGQLTLHYDPKLVVQFTSSSAELVSWDRYESIKVPTHVVWGKHSDLLTADIVQRMTSEGPKPDVTQFEECGHAPNLSNKQDVNCIRVVLKKLGH